MPEAVKFRRPVAKPAGSNPPSGKHIKPAGEPVISMRAESHGTIVDPYEFAARARELRVIVSQDRAVKTFGSEARGDRRYALVRS